MKVIFQLQLDPNHRTATVIKHLLKKFELNIDEFSKYSLHQILSEEKGQNVSYLVLY